MKNVKKVLPVVFIAGMLLSGVVHASTVKSEAWVGYRAYNGTGNDISISADTSVILKAGNQWNPASVKASAMKKITFWPDSEIDNITNSPNAQKLLFFRMGDSGTYYVKVDTQGAYYCCGSDPGANWNGYGSLED